MRGPAATGAAVSTREAVRVMPGVLRLALRPGALELESAHERQVLPLAPGEAVHVLDGHLHARPARQGLLLAAFYYFDAPGARVHVVREGTDWFVLAGRSARQAVL
jgi:hypothetical protein